MRICHKCHEEKSINDFNYKIKAKNLLSPYCKNCSRSYIQNHYANNREYYLKKARARNLRVRKIAREFVWNYLKSKECVDCKEKDIILLEFDHIRDKSMDISKMIRGFYSLAQIKKEVEKCEVRCANCHRRKTALQFGWIKK